MGSSGLEVKGKYTGELRAAALHASALMLPSARWTKFERAPSTAASDTSMVATRTFPQSVVATRTFDHGGVQQRPFVEYDLGVLAPAAYGASFNKTLRRALHGRGMSASRLIRWQGTEHADSGSGAAVRAGHADSGSGAVVRAGLIGRRLSDAPRTCILTLSRDVPHASIDALLTQPWYHRVV
jgi:hypothetical protein